MILSKDVALSIEATLSHIIVATDISPSKESALVTSLSSHYSGHTDTPLQVIFVLVDPCSGNKHIVLLS